MALYTLADLHLAADVAKPMDIFGGRWQGHTEKIIKNWRALVAPEDTIVLGGLLSAGATQGELPEGQEKVPWGMTVSRNSLAWWPRTAPTN